MKQLQKKRNTFRFQIRRKQIQGKMNAIRNQLTQNLYYDSCIKYIGQVLKLDPQMLFTLLYQYFNSSPEVQKIPYAAAIGSYLTSLHFFQRKYKNDGLTHLLIAIHPFLSQDKKYKLSQLKILQELLFDFYGQGERQSDQKPEIFNITFELCIYASKQSKFVLNFNQQEIQQIIKKTHSQLKRHNLKILSLTLLNLQRDCIRNRLKFKLKQIARTIYRWAQSSPNQHKLELKLLTLIGHHLSFEEQQKEIISFLLTNHQLIQLPLLLRFINTQAEESFLSYSDIQQFLHNCPSINNQNQANQLIYTLTNILENDFNPQDLLQMYNTLFIGKMENFINCQTINPMAKLVFWLFMIKDDSLTNELVCCGLKILQIGANKIEDENLLISLSIDLIINQGCSEQDLLQLIGEEMYEKVWDHYANQNNIDDCI